MKKKEFIKAVALEAGCTQKDVVNIIDAAFKTIIDGVNKDGEVVYRDYGKFTCKIMPERRVRDINTGAMITIPEKKRLVFVPFGESKKAMQ